MADSHTKPTIIVTRPSPDGEAFMTTLAQAGISAVFSPVMTIDFTNGINSTSNINNDHAGQKLDLTGLDGFVFTSANGVRALQGRIATQRGAQGDSKGDGQEKAHQNYKQLPAFAVGPATAAMARQAGFNEVIVAEGSVDHLAETIGAYWRGHRGKCVYHPAGSHIAGELKTHLEAQAIIVRREILYQARAREHITPEAEELLTRSPQTAGVTFFSPRSVNLFLEQVGRATLTNTLSSVTAICLSDAVAALARQQSWRSIAIAQTPDSDAMINTITSLYQ